MHYHIQIVTELTGLSELKSAWQELESHERGPVRVVEGLQVVFFVEQGNEVGVFCDC